VDHVLGQRGIPAHPVSQRVNLFSVLAVQPGDVHGVRFSSLGGANASAVKPGPHSLEAGMDLFEVMLEVRDVIGDQLPQGEIPFPYAAADARFFLRYPLNDVGEVAVQGRP
jgi:hypothetical protein